MSARWWCWTGGIGRQLDKRGMGGRVQDRDTVALLDGRPQDGREIATRSVRYSEIPWKRC